MLIKLKGDLDPELTSIGLKAGDEVTAEPDTVSKVGAMNFTVMHNRWRYDCVAWPENYDIIKKK